MHVAANVKPASRAVADRLPGKLGRAEPIRRRRFIGMPDGIYAISKPRIVPFEVEKEPDSMPSRCSIET